MLIFFFAIQEFLLCITVLKERSQVAGTFHLVGKMRCTVEEISDDDTEELRVQSSRFLATTPPLRTQARRKQAEM